MSNLPVISFNTGLVTPHIDVRSDVEKYSSSCRILENMLPLVYGDVERRPGTKYINTANDSPNDVRMVDFIYSSEIAYMCEFGDLYIRFYYDGEILNDGAGDPVEVVTPYLEADLLELHFKQLGDTMWIIHPDYAPRKLVRTTATSFTLTEIAFEKGPFLLRNDLDVDDGVTMTSSVTTVGDTGTLTSTGDTFEAGHVGTIFKLTHARVDTEVTQNTVGTSDPISIKGSFTFNTRGRWTGTVSIERNENSSGWETFRKFSATNDRNIQLTSTEPEDDVQYRINISVLSSGSLDADITVNTSTQDGIVRIDSYVSANVVNITVLAAVASTDATKRWAEGAWSSVRGYPTSVAFFAGRIIYGGTSNNAQTVWFSEVDDYENFEEGTNDADSFEVVLTTTNSIRWIEELDGLVIGTSGDEWSITSNKFDVPITPTNFTAEQISTNGSNRIQPIRVNESILFVDSVGRKIREMTSIDQGVYKSPDLTTLAEDITLGGITSIAYQKNPDSILWCTRSDGALLSMTYHRDQNVVAWGKHILGPNADYALTKSVSVIPGSTEDEIWVSISRFIDGTFVTYIEQMQPRIVSDREDYFYVDSGVSYSGGLTNTLTGLDHLEGEEVVVYGDGAVFEPGGVNGGETTITSTVNKAVTGLRSRYKLKPMRLDIDGSTRGSIRKIPELVVSFLDTFNAKYGTEVDDLVNFNWRTTEAFDSPPDLFTGDKIATFDGGFSNEDSILISGNDPAPCTVRGIIARTERTGR